MHDGTAAIYTARQDAFFWEAWDDRYVLYHRASQKTHYLNQTSAIVIQFLAESPYTADKLADALAEESGEPLSEGLRGNIAELLQRLETQGLVARITDPGAGRP
jgi:PqqD family protein of HPr-rel-A system